LADAVAAVLALAGLVDFLVGMSESLNNKRGVNA
jgi:hypothetical protein